MQKLLVFDFDSTLIKDESLVSLLKFTLESKKLSEQQVKDALAEIEEITLQGIAGKISMVESYKKRLAIANPSKHSVEQYLQDINHLPTQGMVDVIQKVRKEFPDVSIHVISQGPRIVVAPICEKVFSISPKNVHAVDLYIGNENEAFEYIAEDEPMLKRGKSNTLAQIADHEGITSPKRQIVVVGDGVSDMKMKVNGIATAAIGFGLHLQFPETKKLADYYVTEIEQLYPILEGIFDKEKIQLDKHIRDHQVYNFFAGPATMPTSVLQHVNGELLNYEHRLGYSVLEMSHRSKDFDDIIGSTVSNLRHILNIPQDYEILFMQGGSTLQFSAVPLNLCRPDLKQTCDYLSTGIWSKKSAEEATKCFGYSEHASTAVKVHSLNAEQIVQVINGEKPLLRLSENSQFVYYCDNETVNGIEFQTVPPEELFHPDDRQRVRWVCDMSSNFLTRSFDITKFDLVYSCAQKNFGVAGLTVVILKKSLLGKAPSWIPSLLDYKVLADGSSLQNTPTTFSIYVADLVFEWMKEEGGVEEMSKRSEQRSKAIYDYVDGEGSDFYVNSVPKQVRSRINIVYQIIARKDKKENLDLEKQFVKEATEQGLIGLEGHRAVGGVRASCYNALPLKAVEELLAFMKEFKNKNLV